MMNTLRKCLVLVAVFAVPSAALAQFPDRGRPGQPPVNGLVPVPQPGFPVGVPGFPMPAQQREQDRLDYLHYLHMAQHAGHAFIPPRETRVPVVPQVNIPPFPEAAFDPAATRGLVNASEFTSSSRSILPAVKSFSLGGKGILGGLGALAAFFGSLFRRGKAPPE
jgi:hypothetical protein